MAITEEENEEDDQAGGVGREEEEEDSDPDLQEPSFRQPSRAATSASTAGPEEAASEQEAIAMTAEAEADVDARDDATDELQFDYDRSDPVAEQAALERHVDALIELSEGKDRRIALLEAQLRASEDGWKGEREKNRLLELVSAARA